MMRRWLCMLLCASLLLLVLPLPGAAQEIPLASEAAILMDVATGQILCGKNMDARMYPASITKIMTALVALKYGDPGDAITVSQRAYDLVPRSSSHVALVPGEMMRLEHALYALAIVSANDAAVAIAEHVAGSVDAFCQLMNREAAELGAVNTHFSNPNGLPAEDHYTTARDMALITAAALEQPGFLTYFGASAYTIPASNKSEPREMISKNQFIDGTFSCEGLLMSKTGWTSQALGTLVTAARQGDTTLIAVTMKSPMMEDKYIDTSALLSYGFSAYRRLELSETIVKKKMVEQGLEETDVLEGYVPKEVLIPIGDGEADLAITVPGGFDSTVGLAAVPASVDAKAQDGSWIHVTDLLLTIREGVPTEPEEVPEAAAEVLAAEPAPEEKVDYSLWLVLAALLAAAAYLTFKGKKTEK